MNLLKNLFVDTTKNDNKETSCTGPAVGICVTCDNRNHCVWQENNKIYCEHFQ